MWEYYAFKIAHYTLAYLPESVGYLIARIVADIVYVLSPEVRRSISGNMARVLGPGASEIDIRQATRGVLRNAAKNYFDLIRLPRTNLHYLEKRLHLDGFENLEAALDQGKGVIMVTAHLGSFDAAAQVLAAQSVKTTVLVEPLDPPCLLDHVLSLRSSMGLTYAPAQLGSVRALIRSLHRGETVLLTCDRDFTNDGIRADFFGEETSLPVGAVRIAMRTGAAIVPAFNLRRRDGGYDVFMEPAIELVRNGEGAVRENVVRIARVMEQYIRRDPEQWVVLSPIWNDSRDAVPASPCRPPKKIRRASSCESAQ